jgi:putative membrane protein
VLCAVDLLIRAVLNAVGVWAAVLIVDGVDVEARTTAGRIGTYLLVGLIFGLVNAFIRPVAKLISLPLIVLTVGLFALVVNALMFWLVAAISGGIGVPFHVDGFWAAFWGAIVAGIVSWVLSLVVRTD